MGTIAEAPGDLDALAEAIDSGRIVTEADRLYGAQFIRSRILDRTARGVDAEGQSFAPYSKAYAKRKDKAGGRTDQVDLYGLEQHPHMLNAMLGRSTAAGFEVGFYGEEATRAEAINEGLGHQPVRGFFRTTEEDLAQVKQELSTRISARMSRASLGNLAQALEE